MRETEDLKGPGEEAVYSLKYLKKHLSDGYARSSKQLFREVLNGLGKMFRRVLCFLKRKKKTIKAKNKRIKIRKFQRLSNYNNR